WSVAIGDLNGDGILDLAVTNQGSNNVSILLGDVTGAFSAATNYAVGTNPRSLAIGDVNGDGVPDLVVPNQTTNNVSILLGSTITPGTFGPRTDFPAGSQPQS